MRYPGGIGKAYRSQSPVADIEQLINWQLSKIESDAAKAPFAYYPTPGVQDFAHVGLAPIRGLFSQQFESGTERAWAVADNSIVELFADGTFTVNATKILRDNNPVTMTTSGSAGGQLFVTSGGHKYILDLDTNLVTDEGAGATSGVIMGDMMDGFFIALERDRFAISDENDGLTWDPTQFQQRNSAPDPWLALKIVKKRMILLGQYTTDIWRNAGNAPMPFAPIQDVQIREGIAAVFSAAEHMGALVWLAQNRYGGRTVQRLNGYTAEKISDLALDYALGTYARVDDAEGFSYLENGVETYVLNLPTANKTWAYDPIGGWHERGDWQILKGKYNVWRQRCHCYAFGKHLVGDRASDTVFEQSIAFGTDAGGDPLRRMRVFPSLYNEHQLVYVDNLELYFENGLGLPVGQGSNPVAILQKSKNGGRTFGNERVRHVGKIGQYKPRCRFTRLGGGRDLGFRLVVSDPIPWRLIDVLLNEPDAEAA